ncbi:hypothetical protein K502DRAFT_333255 [Neoconidiobolus thromboides FSU 785]|nr:hypothetical protein K502DRAFT_333255 [Neoconidiobolus thromboides FSU 785]
MNKEIYYLNLTEGIKLNERKEANWKVFEVNNKIDKTSEASSINYREEIVVVGGTFTKLEESIRSFNTSTGEWKTNEKGSKFIKYLFGNKTLSYGLKGSTVNINDKNQDQIVIFGGNCELEESEEDDTIKIGYKGVIVYNINKNEWKVIGEKEGHYISEHGAAIYNGVLLIFGGHSFNFDSFSSFESILCFDIENETWYSKSTSGEIPATKIGFRVKLINDKVYMVGGATDEDPNTLDSSPIYVLNLNTFTWKKNMIEGLVTTLFGSLEYYNNHLIYSFGTNLEFSGKTQLINLDNLKLVNKLPSKLELESSPNIAAIIGGSIAGFIVLWIILFFAIRKFRNRKTFSGAQTDPLSSDV